MQTPKYSVGQQVRILEGRSIGETGKIIACFFADETWRYHLKVESEMVRGDEDGIASTNFFAYREECLAPIVVEEKAIRRENPCDWSPSWGPAISFD